jgi:hypothetical protein
VLVLGCGGADEVGKSSTTRCAIAREVIAELEAEWTRQLGKTKMLQLRQLRELLEELNAAL